MLQATHKIIRCNPMINFCWFNSRLIQSFYFLSRALSSIIIAPFYVISFLQSNLWSDNFFNWIPSQWMQKNKKLKKDASFKNNFYFKIAFEKPCSRCVSKTERSKVEWNECKRKFQCVNNFVLASRVAKAWMGDLSWNWKGHRQREDGAKR